MYIHTIDHAVSCSKHGEGRQEGVGSHAVSWHGVIGEKKREEKASLCRSFSEEAQHQSVLHAAVRVSTGLNSLTLHLIM